jgi:hypothetical protein
LNETVLSRFFIVHSNSDGDRSANCAAKHIILSGNTPKKTKEKKKKKEKENAML